MLLRSLAIYYFGLAMRLVQKDRENYSKSQVELAAKNILNDHLPPYGGRASGTPAKNGASNTSNANFGGGTATKTKETIVDEVEFSSNASRLVFVTETGVKNGSSVKRSVVKLHQMALTFSRELLMLQSARMRSVRYACPLLDWGDGRMWLDHYGYLGWNDAYALTFPYFSAFPTEMSGSQFVRYSQQLIEFLADMENAGIVHLDIGPHNILLDASVDEIRVIDFETGRHVPRKGFEVLSGTDAEWGDGETMAPELDLCYLGELKCTTLCDSFSVGATINVWRERIHPTEAQDLIVTCTSLIVEGLTKRRVSERWTGAMALDRWKQLPHVRTFSSPSQKQKQIPIKQVPANNTAHRTVLEDVTNHKRSP